MNLWLRFLWTLLRSRFRSPCPTVGPCLTPFRVLPADLDLHRHMNNARYLALLDLARIDLMYRSGLHRPVKARGWYPVVAAETIQFRRSLKLFQRFTVETRVIGWDDKAFLIQQRFLLPDGTESAAAVVRARFLKRAGGSVSPAEVLAVA